MNDKNGKIQQFIDKNRVIREMSAADNKECVNQPPNQPHVFLQIMSYFGGDWIKDEAYLEVLRDLEAWVVGGGTLESLAIKKLVTRPSEQQNTATMSGFIHAMIQSAWGEVFRDLRTVGLLE